MKRKKIFKKTLVAYTTLVFLFSTAIAIGVFSSNSEKVDAYGPGEGYTNICGSDSADWGSRSAECSGCIQSGSCSGYRVEKYSCYGNQFECGGSGAAPFAQEGPVINSSLSINFNQCGVTEQIDVFDANGTLQDFIVYYTGDCQQEPPEEPEPEEPVGCRGACTTNSDCGTNMWGTQLTCVSGMCLNPGCSAAANNEYCACTGGECGEPCGPSNSNLLCSGTDAYGNELGCILFQDPVANSCQFRCMPNEAGQSTPAAYGICSNSASTNYSRSTIINSQSQLMDQYCEPDLPSCGNGIVEPANGEECDDGNNISGDGCSATCQLEQQAPDLVIDKYVDGPTSYFTGDAVTFKIRMTNTGNTTLTVVEFDDNYPSAHFNYVGGSAVRVSGGSIVTQVNDINSVLTVNESGHLEIHNLASSSVLGLLAPNEYYEITLRFIALAPANGPRCNVGIADPKGPQPVSDDACINIINADTDL